MVRKSKVFCNSEYNALMKRLSGSKLDPTGVFSGRVKPKLEELVFRWVPMFESLKTLVNKSKGETKRVVVMPFKNYEPIKFEFLQTNMEKVMYQLDKASILLSMKKPLFSERLKTIEQLKLIRDDLQRKINQHKELGDWK